jgi:extradiol dioxygenase family protein
MDMVQPALEAEAMLTPFHLAFPVDDLAAARHFYGTVLGCAEGRSTAVWIDFDLFGHQIVAHHKPRAAEAGAAHHNRVDGHDVPVPHFGVVLTMARWEALAARLFGTCGASSRHSIGGSHAMSMERRSIRGRS